MNLRLTPEVLKAAYEYLCTTRPFCNWNMPDADDVRFVVSKAHLYGYSRDDRLEIGVSTYRVATSATLLETMAHEMVHVHLDRRKVKSHHGKGFRTAARQVCREHGFEFKRFI
jgi:hypothetical protein